MSDIPRIAIDLKGKTALVTGAGRGIGRAICHALADAGASIVAAARTAVDLAGIEAAIREKGGTALAVQADISDESQVVNLFRAVKQEFGQLDILVNNAGIGLFGTVAGVTADDLDRVMAVNVKGTFLCCREAMQMMIPAQSGYIINISSVVGIKGYPNQAVYAASKHGVMGLTKALAVEAQASGIRVTAVLPGGVDTDMVKQARPDLDPSILLKAEDIAYTILYLLGLPERAAVDQIYIRRSASAPF